MYSTFHVNGDGCLTCNNQVLKKIGNLQGVFGAEIDRYKGEVVVTHTEEVSREMIEKTLNELGFFEENNNENNCEINA
ncbi:MAG: hypothetical protein H6Q19_64 [Bacteroidetes bacterium]|nr:hypothetical protein [Bacteroidota bacterium]